MSVSTEYTKDKITTLSINNDQFPLKIESDIGLISAIKSSRRVVVTITQSKSNDLLDLFFRLLLEDRNKNILNPTSIGLYGRKDPSKEITESVSAMEVVVEYLRKNYDRNIVKNKKVLCICAADGKGPKTGYVLSMRTKWDILSIDPIMGDEYINRFNGMPETLTCYKDYIENVDFESLSFNYDIIVVIGVHSHANNDNIYQRLLQLNTKYLLLSVPCCGGFQHIVSGVEPNIIIKDIQILSPKNKLYIWTNV